MTESTIRFAIEKGFFVCENEVFNLPLGPIDKLAYLALVRYADSQKRAWPSYKRLAADVGIGRKRAIEAVKTLIMCHLLEKQMRGNRSNIYLVYPARYFCMEKQAGSPDGEVTQNSVLETPSTGKVVSEEHPQGVPRTPSECPRNTLRVSDEHPISTNISTKKNTLSSLEPERENTLIPKDQKIETDLETVREIISRKGYQVNDWVMKEMLEQHTVEEVTAAIECTDFKKARNPVAVIFALLKSGKYVVQKKNKSVKQIDEIEQEEPTDPKIIKDYMQRLKKMIDQPAQERKKEDEMV
ncbi:MAG: helix-turn-helix domain-containing protein [Candidatus Omnitrophica bacterium]|nr:helix-turn-helix domain-containing protein [Candidatus Omnitrophota bacterium]